MLVNMKITDNTCKRCGTCCMKGGPMLHRTDIEILLNGQAGYEDLVTIRKGERVYDPLTGLQMDNPVEMIKVKGKSGGWECVFYSGEQRECTLYEKRFLECRLLKCWDTSDIIGVIGKNTIERADLINRGDLILEIIAVHEKTCPADQIAALARRATDGKDKEEARARLLHFLSEDSSIRSHAFGELGLKREYEYFIFGRPLREILSEYGLAIKNF